MKRIYVHPDSWALVDNVDWLWLAGYHWSILGKGYAGSRTGYGEQPEYMHKMIATRMGLVCEEVDHRNRIRLDNQRHNLRPATSSLNKANRLQHNPLGYRGVKKHHHRYKARIQIQGKEIHLGSFLTPELAAQAYNDAAIHFYGEFAQLNEVKTCAVT